MRVYFYADKEVGVPWPGPDHDFLVDGKPKESCEQWPRFIWYNWTGSTVVACPDEADVFVVRQRLIWLSAERVYTLPHLEGNAHRHVFFDLGPDHPDEAFRTWPGLDATIISATTTAQMREVNPRFVPWCWPVEDLKEWIEPGEFDYDIVFQGQIACGNERPALESIQRSQLRHHIQVNKGFYGTMSGGVFRAQLRHSYLDTMRRSRLSLCPRSNPRGVVRYRFYEAMAMGRCIVSLCDDCVLPMQNEIDYDAFTVFVPEREADTVGQVAQNWLWTHNDQEIKERGAYARLMWERYLKREIWHVTLGEIVRGKLGL